MRAYNFNEQVRTALARSREEALRLGHGYVGTEHLLLGLVHDEDSTACNMLLALSLTPGEVQREIDKIVKRGKPERGVGPDLPYTTRAKKVLELAMSEASELDHGVVGTEHLLVGLLREEQGIAAQVLRAKGVTLDSARSAMQRVLGVRDIGASSTAELLEHMRASRPARQLSISIEVREVDGRLRHQAHFDGTGEAIAFLEALRLARDE